MDTAFPARGEDRGRAKDQQESVMAKHNRRNESGRMKRQGHLRVSDASDEDIFGDNDMF